MYEQWLVDKGLTVQGADALVTVGKFCALIVLCYLTHFMTRRYLLGLIERVIRSTKNSWDDVLIKHKVFQKLAHIAPAVVINFGVGLAFPSYEGWIALSKRVATAYMILIGCFVVDALLNVVLDLYGRTERAQRKPIKGYVQAVMIAVYFFGGLFVLAILLDKSPWGFLSVMGGLTAILLLVFKDTILGFVASIQLSVNNMVSPGDWIEMPKYGADGDVLDVTLTTVKVQNWDKTITTIPTYALISDSFKNWRGMSESGGRRIKRSLYVDMNTIKFLDEPMLEKLQQFNLLKEYLKNKRAELDEYHRANHIDNTQLVNARRLTNVGTFRAYILSYLKHNPKIHPEMTFLVRHLAPTPNGLPIEIYVFSNDQVWANYEGIQADIFDHILAIAQEFDLRIFQNPSGQDIREAIHLFKLPVLSSF